MAENSPAEAEGPTVEQAAPILESPTLVGAPGVGMAPPSPPPSLPAAPGAPPPLPPVTMPPVRGVAPGTVVLIAVLAALGAALLTAGRWAEADWEVRRAAFYDTRRGHAFWDLYEAWAGEGE